MLVFNQNKDLFLGERLGEPGHWQFPQGGVEEEYSLEENVIRELKEELGIKRRQIGKVIKLETTHEYEWENAPKHAYGQWRGQSQTFWAAEFIGVDSDIKIDGDSAEFMNWRWCKLKDVLNLAEARRRDGYALALAEFEKIISRK